MMHHNDDLKVTEASPTTTQPPVSGRTQWLTNFSGTAIQPQDLVLNFNKKVQIKDKNSTDTCSNPTEQHSENESKTNR
jgi:hypothetical protein